MAPKKTTKNAPAQPAKTAEEAFEKNEAARKANSGPNAADMPEGLRDMGIATLLIVLAAVTSNITQLSLAPVYGSIPASVNHRTSIAATAVIAWTTQYFWRPQSAASALQWLPLWAVLTPALVCLSFQFSESLGLAWGPLVGDVVGCHSLVFPMVYAAAATFDSPTAEKKPSNPLAHLISGIPSLGLFLVLDWKMPNMVLQFVARWPSLNPFNVQLLVGIYLIIVLTDRRQAVIATVAVASILAIISPYGNGPFSTILLNASIEPQGWTLLDRQWSNTGYLSVLENTDSNYRVMRCDHSLLGGEWQLTPARRSSGWKTPESIYAAFHMLEAVRLVETTPPIADADAQALVIGLGIGTAPAAFINHGINTTIVELDPAVHRLATEYFALPKPHTPILTDAIAWVNSAAHPVAPEATDDNPSPATPEVQQYDYIVHDVFTGGAEPLPLFTAEFLASLRALLKPNGVAALNYAGDLSLPLTSKVLNTIDLAFGRNCALYRDSAPPEKKAEDEAEAEDDSSSFANYILFCRNGEQAEQSEATKESKPITFRSPTPADFLSSISRAQHLSPRSEFAVDFPSRNTERHSEVLLKSEVGSWGKEQEESARRHWGIMRIVVEAGVWALY